MKNIRDLGSNDYRLEELFGPVGDKAKSSYGGSASDTNTIQSIKKILKPYVGKIVLVQHFGNPSYSRYDSNNEKYKASLEKIPQLTLPSISSIKDSVFPAGNIQIFFSNSAYEKETYFALPFGGSSSIEDFGLVARIVDCERKVLFENPKVVNQWNESFAEHGKPLGFIYPQMLVAFGLGRFWGEMDDPIST